MQVLVPLAHDLYQSFLSLRFTMPASTLKGPSDRGHHFQLPTRWSLGEKNGSFPAAE